MYPHLPSLDIGRYILKMAPVIPHLSMISKESIILLSLFVFEPYLSVYQIKKKLEGKDNKISYKNTHKKIQRLVELKLVERITDESKLEGKNSKRRQKYYEISEEGIFALFCDSRVYINSSYYIIDNFFKNEMDFIKPKYAFRRISDFNKHHNNCHFFRLFLLPWISIGTIENLSIDLESRVRKFLTDCCNIVKESQVYFALNTLSSELTHLNDEIYEIDRSNNPILYLIKKAFFLEIKTVKIKRENNNEIVISKPDDEKLVRLIYKEKEQELEISSYSDNSDRFSLRANSVNEVKVPRDISWVAIDEINLDNLHLNAVFSMMIEDVEDDDLKILREDTLFMKKLDEMNIKFNISYAHFKK